MNESNDTTIGELTTNLNRVRVPLSGIVRKQRPGPYRYFGAQGVIDRIDDYLFDGEYLLIAEDGENLRSRKQPIASLVSGKFWVNNHAHVLKVDDTLANSTFLLHAINLANLTGLVTGAAQPKLTKANLERVRLPAVAKPEQDRIAAVLAAFDELIAINERRIELLEDLARSLYREWFVQFRFPGHSGDVTLHDSAHGPRVPSGWNVVLLRDVATLRYGKALPARSRRPGTVPVISSAGVIDQHDEALVEAPGIVLGRKGNVGSVWWVERPLLPD